MTFEVTVVSVLVVLESLLDELVAWIAGPPGTPVPSRLLSADIYLAMLKSIFQFNIYKISSYQEYRAFGEVVHEVNAHQVKKRTRLAM